MRSPRTHRPWTPGFVSSIQALELSGAQLEYKRLMGTWGVEEDVGGRMVWVGVTCPFSASATAPSLRQAITCSADSSKAKRCTASTPLTLVVDRWR